MLTPGSDLHWAQILPIIYNIYSRDIVILVNEVLLAGIQDLLSDRIDWLWAIEECNGDNYSQGELVII